MLNKQSFNWRSALTVPQISRRGDIAVIAFVVAVIIGMVLPIPIGLLDFLIVINISASVALLMLSVYVPSATALSTFPSLLVFTTALRLSLNIATTKQILLNAYAGHVVETFGKLVMGGNALVGGVVFIAIAVVQFIVIAKGSERVAEVGARFTLDGMPGKQMSIDADVRAGTLTPEEARKRRSALETESQWHGAMDGAMKFVKGDAIAALILAFINIVAGIGEGARKGMSIGEAVNRYTLLTVGDGMVSQIASLFVSLAAAILITRVSGPMDKKTNLGTQLMSQLLSQPMSLAMTGVVVLAFTAVPGFPKIQFALVGMAIGLLAHIAFKHDRKPPLSTDLPMPAMKGDAEREAPIFIEKDGTRSSVPMLVGIAPDMQKFLRADEFAAALTICRQRLYSQLGLPFPGVRLRYDATLDGGKYRILAQDIQKARGELYEGSLRVTREHPQAAALASQGKANSSAFGGFAEGVWIEERLVTENKAAPFAITPEQTLAEHVATVMRENAELFLGIQEVQRIVEDTSKTTPELAQELMRAVPLQRIADVMRRLVQEGISVRNVREIFESLVTWSAREKDIVLLTEYVRIDLGAVTVSRLADGRSELPVIALTPDAEATIRSAIQTTIGGSFLALGLDRMDSLHNQIAAILSDPSNAQAKPILACSMDVRRYIKKAIEGNFPALQVLSYQELGNHVKVAAVGQIAL
jgi:type III secretion protein V